MSLEINIFLPPLEHTDAHSSSRQSPRGPRVQCVWYQVGQCFREGEQGMSCVFLLFFYAFPWMRKCSPLQGTVIRVFSVPEGQRLFEFRRGMKRLALILSNANERGRAGWADARENLLQCWDEAAVKRLGESEESVTGNVLIFNKIHIREEKCLRLLFELHCLNTIFHVHLRYVSISSLSFSADAHFLCASSNTETVHIFKLEPHSPW